jgi:membrane associated rhomboid family serine protease
MSIVQQYVSLIKHHLPSPPLAVISTGVSGFIILSYIFSWFNADLIPNWAVSPVLLAENHELHRLNTYPLVHTSFLHMFFNLLMIYYPLSEFEVSHGSLHTAIVINTLGAVTGIAYTITTYILTYIGLENKEILSTYILGSSGWIFTFITVSSCHKSLNHPTTKVFNVYNVPTLLVPLIYLVISELFVPSSSFLGHLISIILGILIFKNIFSLITIPPFQILDKIESLDIFKSSIESIFPSNLFIWTWEQEVKSSRYQDSEFNGIGLPLHHEQVVATNNIPDNTDNNSNNTLAFQGDGEKLGSNL